MKWTALLAPAAAILAACASRHDPAQEPPRAPAPTAATSAAYAYTIEELGPGVFAFVQPVQHGGLVSGNVLVVVGDDGVLVVDTGHFPSLAKKMIADIRRVTDKKVRYVITTHWHPDHLLGNATFKEAFPDVTFVAHTETRRLAALHDPEYVDKQRNQDKLLAKYRQILATGKRPNGKDLTSDEKEMVTLTVPELEETLGDADVTLVPPTTVFDDEMTLHLGTREIRVMHLGRGNTAGDAVVYVPDAKVLATGDVVVAPTPYAYGSYFGDWIAVLQKIEALDVRALVPGHGPVQHDMTYVRTLEGLFTSLRAQAKDAVAAGMPLEDARKKIDLDSFRRTMAKDPGDRLVFDVSFVAPGVERAYQEAKGKLEDE